MAKILFQLYIEEEHMDYLESLSDKFGNSKAYFIREMIDEHMKQNKLEHLAQLIYNNGGG